MATETAQKGIAQQPSASSLASIDGVTGNGNATAHKRQQPSTASALPARKPDVEISTNRAHFWPHETQQQEKTRLHCVRLKQWLPLFDQLAEYATGALDFAQR